MKVLIVGGGGREHALAWKVSQSDRVRNLYCAPGNAGTSSVAENIPVAAEDVERLVTLARERQIDLTIVGPEEPLCRGIVDVFGAAGLRILGPTAAAARLEGDKAFAKQFMKSCAIPTAEARIFDNFQQAREYVATREFALVVKAAGLARGKGVVMCNEPSEALLALEKIMVDRMFGEAGAKVVVEERLEGPEVSLHALVDGRNIYVLETSQDHKRVGENDTGPNTGGMGAYSPAEILGEREMRIIYTEILVPLVDAMNRQDTPYKGVLYVGLMLTPGGPKVLEFNCRFGDPETQVLLPRLRTDFVDIADAVIDGRLDQIELQWESRSAVCVVLASGGYPEGYRTGRLISGLEQAGAAQDVHIFHSGTMRANQQVLTHGGRVLGITALGADVSEARRRAYAAVDQIQFEGAYFRRDIAAHPSPATST